MNEYDDLEDEDIEYDPPTAERVRRRAWALSCVIYRSFLEKYDDLSEAATGQSRILNWVDVINLQDEFEPDEWGLIESDIGTITEQAVINGTWRSEGLAVLAWALGAFELPPHDQMSNPKEATDSIFFLADDALAKADQLQLRPSEELEKFCAVQLSLHWRLRDFSIRSEAMNFREFPETAWFGPIDLSGVPFAEDDLAINGQPIAKAPPEEVQLCSSIAMERHKAINWLNGWHEIYSEVDTST